MDYIITGRNATGAMSLRRDSAMGVIKKAVELMGDGHVDVQITPQTGESTATQNLTNSRRRLDAPRPGLGNRQKLVDRTSN